MKRRIALVTILAMILYAFSPYFFAEGGGGVGKIVKISGGITEEITDPTQVSTAVDQFNLDYNSFQVSSHYTAHLNAVFGQVEDYSGSAASLRWYPKKLLHRVGMWVTMPFGWLLMAVR